MGIAVTFIEARFYGRTRSARVTDAVALKTVSSKSPFDKADNIARPLLAQLYRYLIDRDSRTTSRSND